MPSANIKSILKKKVVLLDGAMGTELQKKGMTGGVCPELWCLQNPHMLRDLYASYQKAGAEIIYTCTFGANRFKLKQYHAAEDTYKINYELARLAKDAAVQDTLVAGDIGPTGLFVEPFGPLPFEEVVETFKEQAKGLLDGGCDLIIIETMIDIQEARAALIAVRELQDVFTMVSMTYEEDGHTLGGTNPVVALITLQSLGADVVGCNCSTGPEKMVDFIAAMKPYATVPLLAKPNAGMPKLLDGKTVFDMDAKVFASFGRALVKAGANLIGGCCGTTPNHIRALAKTINRLQPIAPLRKSIGALSSAREFLLFEENRPLVIAGERINPTGKKALQQELIEGKFSMIRQMAMEQEEQGAHLLDVNVGHPGVDEPKKIKEVLSLLSTLTKLPLAVDSSNIEAVEAGLRIYPGRMLINSISGEKEKLSRLLPLAAKYGAMFILLPLMGSDLPHTAQKRQRIIKHIYQRAKKHGFTKDDFIVDCLVLAVASNPQAASETLKTLQWCAKTFHGRTNLGISNVSFGMPGRPWLNAAFLAMAQYCGLTMAIANPGSAEIMNVKKAADVLIAKDPRAVHFIEHFSTQTGRAAPQAPAKDGGTLEEKIAQVITQGDTENIVPLLESALRQERPAQELVNLVMIPAIVRVGDLYEKKIYFLPQLMAAAETMKKGLSFLEPLLKKDVLSNKGKIILATVKGDIHDIGKNIVALLLRNYGYQVTDLGKDVAASEILQAARTENPDIIGLSALMTTTMVRMKEIISAAKEEGLSQPFLVGGAVVTEEYANSIGAAYAKDGVEAVKVVEQLMKK
jgi:5-methyltetrahydrofolate--homocysteine methyltransferase